MKKTVLILFLLSAAGCIFAAQYENPMLNMDVPTGLEQGQTYFKFDHKFYQALDKYPKNDMFALFDNQVNMNIELRYLAVAGLEINAGYTTKNREQTAGLSYALNFHELHFSVQAGLEFFTYRDSVHGNFDQNLFYSLDIQSEPLLDDKLILSLDAGYDGYALNPGLAIGASYEILRDISLLAECYPVIKLAAQNDCIGPTSVYFVGFKIQTSGHQFIFKFGNSTDIGMRRMMLGVTKSDLYAGFSIMRLIRF